MKLLLDQNLSRKLTSHLEDIFPGSGHVFQFGLSKADDLEVRKFALENEFIIVTRDSDFYDLALMFGIPPKVVWIRSGNSSTKFIEELLRYNFTQIEEFINHKDKICLELF